MSRPLTREELAAERRAYLARREARERVEARPRGRDSLRIKTLNRAQRRALREDEYVPPISVMEER